MTQNIGVMKGVGEEVVSWGVVALSTMGTERKDRHMTAVMLCVVRGSCR